MDRWDIHLTRDNLKGRIFLLGNKRAFSLSQPAARGASDTQKHPHKWFGTYLYGHKFLEGQVVRAHTDRDHLLTQRVQTGLTVGLTHARREYEIDDRPISETYFVPDGISGIACTFSGDASFSVEPELDLRLALDFSTDIAGYEVEPIDGGVLVSRPLPGARYDDLTESFIHDGQTRARLYAAVAVTGDAAACTMLPAKQHGRRRVFSKDQHRRRQVGSASHTAETADHAPLWDRSQSTVFAPARLHFRGHGTVFYGFGASREEALDQLAALRENLIGFEAQKAVEAAAIVEHARLETGNQRTDTAYVQVLTRLCDALVARNVVTAETALDAPASMILAGNQYFHDSWKRDENIAAGFLLALGFYDLARDVIRDTWQLQDPVTGRLPQRIRAGEAPAYHSSDGTLWALRRLYEYWRCSGDDSLLYQKLPMARLFFEKSLERCIDGMLPSGRTHSEDYLWETWMDTPHTPRDGFPVEIQMLWISCLRVYRPVIAPVEPELERRMAAAEAAAWHALERFNRRGLPADSLDRRGEPRDLITPNAYFCFGVDLDLGPEMERTMRDIGRRELAGRRGILTLAPRDWERVFPPEFLADRRHVRGRRMRSVGKFNYHRGVEWNWLTRFFVEAELKYGEADTAYRTYLRNQVEASLAEGGIGGISELHDLSGSRGPEFQTWSMAGFLESIHAFAGVRIDVPTRTIEVEPQIPDAWPRLDVRKWYGSIPFDVRYTGGTLTRSLRIEFPHGEAPDADVDVSLIVPPRRAPERVDVCLDGVPHMPTWKVENIPGSDRQRVRLRVPAHASIDISLATKRISARAVA